MRTVLVPHDAGGDDGGADARPASNALPFASGARYEGEVFHLDGAQCVAAGDTSLEHYEPGAPLDPGAYGVVTERTE